jgi:hypothetical protein
MPQSEDWAKKFTRTIFIYEKHDNRILNGRRSEATLANSQHFGNIHWKAEKEIIATVLVLENNHIRTRIHIHRRTVHTGRA